VSAPVNFEADAEAKANPPWESRVIIVPNEWYETAPPARRWLLRDARTAGREGVFPLGKVGLLAAAGGAGKTTAVVQLTVAVATQTPWLGAFEIPEAGKVLLALGEEDGEEVHRRIYRATREAGKNPPEGSITVLPLAGMTCRMVDGNDDAPFLTWFTDYLKKTGPYALVVVDPVSRFAGADTERDNAAATRFVTALESLIEPSGGASVLGSHHTNQTSRGQGATVDATSVRGVSALVDGSRWVSVVQVERITSDDRVESVVTLSMAKSNYSMFAAPVVLRYGDGGVLVPMTDDERAASKQARDEADPKARRERLREEAKSARNAEIDSAVIACVTATLGIGSTDLRTQVKARAGCGPDAADTGIARVIQAGRVRRTEGKTKQHYIVEPPANDAAPNHGYNGVGAGGPHEHMALEDV
jgi:RecA-family ATPase